MFASRGCSIGKWMISLATLFLGSHLSRTSTNTRVLAFAPSQTQHSSAHHSTITAPTTLYSSRSLPSRSHRFFTRIGLLRQRRTPKLTTNLGNDDASTGIHTTSAVPATTTVKPNTSSPQRTKIRVETLDQLESYFRDDAARFRDEKTGQEINYDALIKALDVRGDTQMIGSPDLPLFTHPVAQVLQKRAGKPRPTSQADYDEHGRRKSDGCRIALAIEGGGMRGCISAGMICALGYLNMTAAFDVYYGSSAGSIVGAYAITDQLQWMGPEVYYDSLTTAGRSFIDTRRLLRAIGFGLVDPRLYKDVLLRRNNGKPVLDLNYLLKTTMQNNKPLDWETFVERQKVQPLKIVASGLQSEKPFVMEMAKGHFTTLSEMSECMHASCLLPGIAGPLMNLNTKALGTRKPKMILGNNVQKPGYEPLADALVYEPLPYRSALAENCTHAVVVRSRPDGVDVTGKSSFFEKLIFRRFFLRKNFLPHILEYFRKHLHKKLYAEDIIRLNEAAKSTRDPYDLSEPHLMTVAAPPGSAEVTRLEVGRETIFAGFRRGFARCYDCLVADPAERGRGMHVALEFFPDEILDYDPLEYGSSNESAFRVYMREKKVVPKIWKSKKPETVTL